MSKEDKLEAFIQKCIKDYYETTKELKKRGKKRGQKQEKN